MINYSYYLYLFALGSIITYATGFFLEKKKILLDNHLYSHHKKLSNKRYSGPPLCGGIIILFVFIFEVDLVILNIFIFLLLIIGILSDINFLVSPKKRIIFQTLIVLFFVITLNVKIYDLRSTMFNEILKNDLVSIFFTVFCILVLINGTNFIDGLNTLCLGYYINVILIIIFLANKHNFLLDQNISIFLIVLIVLFIFNLLKKIFLGDSGSYVIALLTAFFTIKFSYQNTEVSPYFICLLLWYPAFENLFTILRRLFFKKKTHNPDQLHLHHLIFFFFKKKKFNDYISNTLSGFLINIFNLCIILSALSFYDKTKKIIFILFVAIISYCAAYFALKKK